MADQRFDYELIVQTGAAEKAISNVADSLGSEMDKASAKAQATFNRVYGDILRIQINTAKQAGAAYMRELESIEKKMQSIAMKDFMGAVSNAKAPDKLFKSIEDSAESARASTNDLIDSIRQLGEQDRARGRGVDAKVDPVIRASQDDRDAQIIAQYEREMKFADDLADKKIADAQRTAQNKIKFDEEASSKELQAQIDAAGKADQMEQQRASADQRHADRVQSIVQDYKKLNDAYSDPSAKAAIDARRDALIQSSNAIRTMGLSSTEENQRMAAQSKEHMNDLKQELNAIRSISDAEKARIDKQISSGKKRQDEDFNNLKTRFQHHLLLLDQLDSVQVTAAAKYTALEQQKTTMTLTEVRERTAAIKRETAAAVGAKIDEVTQFENLERSKNASYGRATSNVFMIQQAFEDFQYAGIRGAANNIAMIASNIGGQSGIIALTAIMGVQLASSLGLFEKIREASGGLLGKTQEQLEAERMLLDLRIADSERLSKQRLELAQFNPFEAASRDLELEKAKASVKEVEHQKEVDRVARVVKLHKELRTVQDAIVQLQSASANGGDLGDSAAMLGEMRDNARDLAREIESLDFSATAEGEKAAKRKLEEYTNTLRDTQSEIETTTKKMEKLFGMGDLAAEFKRGTSGKIGTDSPGGAFGNLFSSLATEQNLALESTRKDIAQNISEILLDINKTEDEKRAGIEEELTLLAKAKEILVAQSNELRVGVEYANDTNEKLKENVSEIEKQVSATEQLIRADEKHLDTISKKISALEDEFGASAVDRAGKLADVKAKQANEDARNEHTANKRKLDDMQKFDNEALEQRAKYLKNRRSKDKSFDQSVDSEKSKFKQEMDKFYSERNRQLDDQLQAKIKSNNKTADLAKKTQLEEYADKQKGKLAGLMNKARNLSSEGKFGEAMQITEQMDKLLKEMLQATDKTIQGGTVAEAEKAVAEAEKLEEAILRNAKDQAQLDKRKIESNKAIHDEQMQLLEAQKAELEEMSKITSINPGNLAILDGIINRLDVAKAKMLEMQSIQFVGSGTGGPAPRGLSGIGVGVGAGGAPGIAPQAPAAGPGPRAMLASNVIHNNFSANMSQASPSAVFSAMAAAAQISAIRRA